MICRDHERVIREGFDDDAQEFSRDRSGSIPFVKQLNCRICSRANNPVRVGQCFCDARSLARDLGMIGLQVMESLISQSNGPVSNILEMYHALGSALPFSPLNAPGELRPTGREPGMSTEPALW